MNARARLSVNPIAYWLDGGNVDRSTENLALAMNELSAIGYRYVKADVPSDMEAAAYLDWLAGYGMKPAITLFSASFADPTQHEAVAERARQLAAQQATFGLRYLMVSTMEGPDFDRMLHPAIGHGHDAETFRQVIEGIHLTCEAMQSEGVTAALHPHIGGRIETDAEIRQVLEAIDASLLKFAPDTGHMTWAGVDVADLIGDYADRVVALHLKDAFSAGIAKAKAEDLGYRQAQATRELWAEPGRGDIDFAEILKALPADFDGDFMIEVDVPSVPSKRESHQISYDWATFNLPIH